MRYVLRHLLSILLLPATVLIVVPIWIARRGDGTLTAPGTAAGWMVAAAGAAIAAAGLGLFAASLGRFASDGRGTLAPWDPPRRLVIRGPYRYVRNPMIAGVLLMLLGTALILRSWPHAGWAGVFALVNALFITFYEEPRLEARFGERYRTYRRAVPRFLPRLRPWTENGA